MNEEYEFKNNRITKKGETSSYSGEGIGVLGLLGVAFVVLKLCHIINWSWWLVTLPFWGGFALVIFVIVLIYIFI